MRCFENSFFSLTRQSFEVDWYLSHLGTEASLKTSQQICTQSTSYLWLENNGWCQEELPVHDNTNSFVKVCTLSEWDRMIGRLRNSLPKRMNNVQVIPPEKKSFILPMHLDSSLSIEQNALWTQISMKNSTSVTIFHGWRNLIQVALNRTFWELKVDGQSTKIGLQIQGNVIKHQIHLHFIYKHIFQSIDIIMPQFFQDGNFTDESWNDEKKSALITSEKFIRKSYRMVDDGMPWFQSAILISFKTTVLFVNKFFALWMTHLEFSDNFSTILISSMFAE